MDARPDIEDALAAFGLDATVTPPGQAAVPTRAMWLPPLTVEVPAGADHRRAEVRRVAAIPTAAVAAVPLGSILNMPEFDGEAAVDWKVDATQRADHDHHRVLVVPA